MRSFVNICRLCLIFLYVYTAFSKLVDLEKFEQQISQITLLKEAPVVVFGFLFIGEVVSAILLAYKKTMAKGFLLSSILLLLFTLYITSILISSRHLPCSCGGIMQKLSWTQHLILNCFLLGASLYCWRYLKKSKGDGVS